MNDESWRLFLVGSPDAFSSSFAHCVDVCDCVKGDGYCHTQLFVPQGRHFVAHFPLRVIVSGSLGFTSELWWVGF